VGLVAMPVGTPSAVAKAGRFAVFRQLMADGIECMFGNPGSSEQNLLDALRAREFQPFKYYLALHEGPAVAMADSYARATRRPAVVQLHSYAGLANGLGMMNYARRGYTPLVVIVGEAGLKYEALDGQMAADLVTMARPFVKSDHNGPCAWRVVDSGSVLRLLRRALKAAATPPAGPVLLVLPMDVLDEENTEPVVPSVPVRTSSTPDPETIAQAARLLAAATHPIILMGDGIAAADAQPELARVASLLGAVVWGANSSEVNLPSSHALYAGDLGHMFGAASKGITSAADAVLICGTTVLPEVFPALEGVFAPDASVVHFDLNSYEIGKNFSVGVGAVGDPKATLAALAEALERVLTGAQRARAKERADREADRKREIKGRELAADRDVRDAEPLHMSRFVEELQHKWPAGTLVFDEALTNSSVLRRYLPQDEAGTVFQTRAGMLGTGLPGAIGLKLARPDRTVFGFSGDGGSISTIQALATAARYKIAAKFVVCNNLSYRILKYNLQEYWDSLNEPRDQSFPPEFDLTFPTLRFDQLAEGQGVRAVRVERASEIGPALTDALETYKDEPFLIDLVLTSAL
jgi:benzoylformate decarboxylase